MGPAPYLGHLSPWVWIRGPLGLDFASSRTSRGLVFASQGLPRASFRLPQGLPKARFRLLQASQGLVSASPQGLSGSPRGCERESKTPPSVVASLG